MLKAAHVAATGSARKTDFLKGLGADEVIDYHTVDYTEQPERYDIVYDTVGKFSPHNILQQLVRWKIKYELLSMCLLHVAP